MRYVNLGATGLRVSRVCLGMMSFGKHEERPWALGEDEAEPSHQLPALRRRYVLGSCWFQSKPPVGPSADRMIVFG